MGDRRVWYWAVASVVVVVVVSVFEWIRYGLPAAFWFLVLECVVAGSVLATFGAWFVIAARFFCAIRRLM